MKVDIEKYKKHMCSQCGDKKAMDCEETDDEIQNCFESALPLE